MKGENAEPMRYTSSQYLQELGAEATATIHRSPLHAVNKITARTAKASGLLEHQSTLQETASANGDRTFSPFWLRVQKVSCT